MASSKHNIPRGTPVHDLRGQTFDRLTAQRYVSGSRWECLCVCGRTTIVKTSCLTNGHTRSCGCLKDELMLGNSKAIRHGLTHHPIYKRWATMLQRCYSPTAVDFYRYGGRGITVCARWRHSVKNFYADMGDPPPGMTLDRYPDVNGNYEPTNCRWATLQQQSRNKRKHHLLTYNNETHPVIVWAEKFNLPAGMLYKRKHAGWSDEKTLTMPQGYSRKRKRA